MHACRKLFRNYSHKTLPQPRHVADLACAATSHALKLSCEHGLQCSSSSLVCVQHGRRWWFGHRHLHGR
eukprot:s2302_g10.t1